MLAQPGMPDDRAQHLPSFVATSPLTSQSVHTVQAGAAKLMHTTHKRRTARTCCPANAWTNCLPPQCRPRSVVSKRHSMAESVERIHAESVCIYFCTLPATVAMVKAVQQHTVGDRRRPATPPWIVQYVISVSTVSLPFKRAVSQSVSSSSYVRTDQPKSSAIVRSGAIMAAPQAFVRKKLRKNALSQQDDGEEFLNLDYTPCINCTCDMRFPVPAWTACSHRCDVPRSQRNRSTLVQIFDVAAKVAPSRSSPTLRYAARG